MKDDEDKQRIKMWSYRWHPEHWRSDSDEIKIISAILMGDDAADKI